MDEDDPPKYVRPIFLDSFRRGELKMREAVIAAAPWIPKDIMCLVADYVGMPHAWRLKMVVPDSLNHFNKLAGYITGFEAQCIKMGQFEVCCKQWDNICAETSHLLFDENSPILHLKPYKKNKDRIDGLLSALDYRIREPVPEGTPIDAAGIYNLLYEMALVLWPAEDVRGRRDSE